MQEQVTDVLEESIQSLGELYYLKTENRAGMSKITVYVKKEIRADQMQQLWDKLRRKVSDVQSKLPAGAGPSVVNDDFGDVLGVFYGITGDGRTYRELEDQAKLLKNELLKVKDVARVEVYGMQTPTIDVTVRPSQVGLPSPGTIAVPRDSTALVRKRMSRQSLLAEAETMSPAAATGSAAIGSFPCGTCGCPWSCSRRWP